MGGNEVRALALFTVLALLGGFLFFGFLILALFMMAFAVIVFLGVYGYIKLKLWWRERHPPKELEGPEDYLSL